MDSMRSTVALKKKVPFALTLSFSQGLLSKALTITILIKSERALYDKENEDA